MAKPLERSRTKYTRIYAGPDGESHFDEVIVDLVAKDFAPPTPLLNVSAPVKADQLVFIELPRGWYGQRHLAPRRQLWFQTAGQMEVEVDDGAVRRFGPGDVVLLDDVAGKGHVTRAVGQGEVRGIFVQLP